METVAAFWEVLASWWAGLPPLPDLGLQPPGDPDVLIVVASVLLALGLVALISGWVERRLSWPGAFAFTLALALFFWVWETDREGFGWISVPEAFVEMVARVIR